MAIFNPYKTIENVAAAEFMDGGEDRPFKALEIALDYVSGGRTNVLITDTGKDLLEGINFTDGVINENGTVSTSASIHYSDPIDVTDIAEVFAAFRTTASGTNNLRVHAYSGTSLTDWTAQLKAIPLTRYYYTGDTVSIPAGTKYIRISVSKTGTSLTCSAGGWYNLIPLGETPIYGGTLDVLSGKLTSTLDENGEPLETPVVTTITGLALTSLLRENNLTASSGNIIKLTYEIEWYKLKGEDFDLKSGYYMINGSGLDLTGGLR